MSITSIFKQGEEFVKENSSTILTTVGVVGTVTTAVLTGRATLKAAKLIHGEALQRNPDEAESVGNDFSGLPDLGRKEKINLVWSCYIPPVASGVFTVTSIIMANHINSKKIATLAAMYSLSENRFADYKSKVLEKVGKTKETAIQDEAAQERVNNAKGSEVIITGDNTVLCFDQFTGRFFNSTMETIKRAENRVNAEIFQTGGSSLSSFYEEIGLSPTSITEELGWNNETTGTVDVVITSTISPDGRPCLAIDFANSPRYDWVDRQH